MHIVDTDKYIAAVREMLAAGKTNIPLPVVGNSMRPFLKDGDTVYLSPADGKIRRGDILLFVRRDGHGVLHRVAHVKRDMLYMLGDSQLEKEPIARNAVIARAASAKRSPRRAAVKSADARDCEKGMVITARSPVWLFYRYIYPRSPAARRLLSRLRALVR